MTRAARAVALSALLLSVSTAGVDALAAGPGRGTTHTIVIDSMRYEPAALTVSAGDRVVWVNKDPFPHTATAAGVYDSGSIASGKSWTWIAKTKGEHAYLCTLHPTMKAVLTVH